MPPAVLPYVCHRQLDTAATGHWHRWYLVLRGDDLRMRPALRLTHRYVKTFSPHEGRSRVLLTARSHMADPLKQLPHILSPTSLATLGAVCSSQSCSHRLLQPRHGTPLMRTAAAASRLPLLDFLPAVLGAKGCNCNCNFFESTSRASVGCGVERHKPQLCRCRDSAVVPFRSTTGDRPGI